MRRIRNDHASPATRHHLKRRIVRMSLMGVVLASATAFAAPPPPDVSFGPAVEFPVGNNPSALAVGDFNGDNKPDLVVTDLTDNQVSVLLGQGDGSFGPATAYSVGFYPSAVATGDFNKDGKLDIAVANVGNDTVSILLGNGDGTFQAAKNIPAGTYPTAIAVGDFDGDGKIYRLP